MGLFKDEIAPSGNETRVELQNKMFISSKISPFQANLIFEVYKDKETELRLLVNEKVVKIPGCSQGKDDLCSFETFQKQYASLIGCNFDEICQNSFTTFGGFNQK